MFWHSLMPGVFLCERSRVLFTTVILQSGDRQKSPSAAVDTWESNTRLTSYLYQTVRDFFTVRKTKNPRSVAAHSCTYAKLLFFPTAKQTDRESAWRRQGRVSSWWNHFCPGGYFGSSPVGRLSFIHKYAIRVVKLFERDLETAPCIISRL